MAKKTIVEENKEILEKVKKDKEKKERKRRIVNNDIRKVYYASGKETTDVPKILIEGNWLKDIGFPVGSTYKLIVENDKLTLIKNA